MPPKRLAPTTTITELAESGFLDSLSGAQLVVYIRLLAATHQKGSKKVQVINTDLYREPRTAVKALRQLEEMPDLFEAPDVAVCASLAQTSPAR